MNDSFHIGGTKIEYELIYTNRKKTMQIELDINNGCTVRAPSDMTMDEIITNLERKSKWIITHLDKMAEITRHDSQNEFVSGEKFLVRGRRYPLKVKQDDVVLPSLSFEQSVFRAAIPKGVPESQYYHLLRPLFIQFYQRKAKQVINERIRKYIKYFDDSPKDVKIQSLKNKWGSCSPQNLISYNWRIIMAKTSIIDYVVVHELCHMKHKNHSKKFWHDVETILPDYKICKDWLRVNGDMLKI
jgi:predicted metal-dependent hydrolase